MPAGPVRVDWEIAADDGFRRVVHRGHQTAVPEDGHTLHVEPHGLRPDATYWFRFKAGGEISPVGRTHTAPHPWQRPRRVSTFARFVTEAGRRGVEVA